MVGELSVTALGRRQFHRSTRLQHDVTNSCIIQPRFTITDDSQSFSTDILKMTKLLTVATWRLLDSAELQKNRRPHLEQATTTFRPLKLIESS